MTLPKSRQPFTRSRRPNARGSKRKRKRGSAKARCGKRRRWPSRFARWCGLRAAAASCASITGQLPRRRRSRRPSVPPPRLCDSLAGQRAVPWRAFRLNRLLALTISLRSVSKRKPGAVAAAQPPVPKRVDEQKFVQALDEAITTCAVDIGGAAVAQPRSVPNDDKPTPSVGRIANPSNQLADWQSALRPGPNTYSSRSAERPSVPEPRVDASAVAANSACESEPLARRSGVPPLKKCGGTPHLRHGTPARRCRRRAVRREARLRKFNFRSRFGGCWLTSPGALGVPDLASAANGRRRPAWACFQRLCNRP